MGIIMKKYSVLNSCLVVLLVFVFARNMINSAKADSLFGGDTFFSESTTKSDTNTIWKSDGSLVIIKGAEESGYVVKGDDSGSNIEYFVVPKDDGSNTFIYDNGLTICNTNGCY
jgi:hypothetical protein